MRLILAALALSAAFAGQALAADPAGQWRTEDGRAVIEIKPCDQGLCGRIVGQSEPLDDKGQPKRDVHGNLDCGLQILHLKADDKPGVWSGVITDPGNGTDWQCEVSLNADGTLHLRGYVLLPLLGKTQTWTAFKGHLAQDCAMLAQ